MTLCSRCGDCCENIHVGYGTEEVLDRLAAYWEALRDKSDDGRFILTHWNIIRVDVAADGREDPVFACDKFDPVERLCTAHEERPQVCRGFPWYDHGVADPGEDLPWRHVSKRCSYLADVVNRMAVGG